MKTILLLIALLGAPVATLWARLGETEAECEARYGKSSATLPHNPIQLEESRKQFMKEGIEVTISFWKGRAVQVYYKIEPGLGLADLRISTLLQANAAGSEWTLDNADGRAGGPYKKWKRKDGLATAHVDQWGLEINEVAFQEALKVHYEELNAAAAAAEKERLKGF